MKNNNRRRKSSNSHDECDMVFKVYIKVDVNVLSKQYQNSCYVYKGWWW